MPLPKDENSGRASHVDMNAGREKGTHDDIEQRLEDTEILKGSGEQGRQEAWVLKQIYLARGIMSCWGST